MAETDFTSVVRREARHSALRARNGLNYLAGLNPPPVGKTPKDVVWRQDRVEVWRYRSDERRFGPPIVVFLGLVSRSYVLDLLPTSSFVASLGREGFDVFLVDWGVPTDADADNTFETYASFYLPRALEAVMRESGTDEVTLLSYCMGGMLALMTAATRPDIPIRAMAMLAPPVDFSEMGTLIKPLVDGDIDPEALIDDKGFVPGETIRSFFSVRRPTSDIVQYVNLWEKLWDDEYVEAHRAMAQWMRNQIPLAGALFRQTTQMFLRDNAFMNGTARLNGKPISLRNVEVPILSVTAEADDIVPVAASTPLRDLVAGEVTEVRIPSGHVSLVMGRQSEKTTMPAIKEWLTAISDPVEEAGA